MNVDRDKKKKRETCNSHDLLNNKHGHKYLGYTKQK